MTGATKRVRRALAIWPGTVVEVAQKAGISRPRICHWKGHKGGRYSDPSESDVLVVEAAIRALLIERLGELEFSAAQLMGGDDVRG